MRRCPRCREDLDESEFGKRASKCRSCDAEYSKQRRAQAGQRRETERRNAEADGSLATWAPLADLLRVCAIAGGCGNAPSVIRSKFPVDAEVTGA